MAKRDYKHEAEIAAGTTLALGTPAVSRIEQGQAKARLKRLDQKIDAHVQAKPKTPSRDSRYIGGRYQPEGSKQKFARQQAKKEWAGKYNQLNAKRNKIARPKVYPKQTKLWAAGLATGVPLAWHGARNHKDVSKKLTQREVDYAVGGGAAGFAGYQGGSLALKPLEKPAERKIKSNKQFKTDLAAHRAATLPKNAKAGDPAWRKYNRTYPKHLPGAKLKRANAVAVSGKSGGVLTLAAIGAGGTGAVKYARRKGEVKKMSDTEIRHRKKVQGAVSYTTGTLGLTALGGTLLATKTGSKATKAVFTAAGRPRPGILKPKNLRQKTAPILATGAGIGGAGSFNFAAYTRAESKKKRQAAPVKKSANTSAFGVCHD